MQERGRGEPRHQRRVLDRIPRVVAAPPDLDVRPVRAEQLPDAERRPREERPAARGDDPALVGAAGEQRAHAERERHGQPDVAEVEERRVREHVRVLQARVEARALGRRRLRPERARDDDEHEREERRDRAEDRHRPRDEVGRAAAVEEDRRGRIARRARAARAAAILPARPRTRRSSSRSAAPSTCAARRTMNEKSWRTSAESSTAACDGRRAERREQRVPRRVGEAAPMRARGPARRRPSRRRRARARRRARRDRGRPSATGLLRRARTSTGTSSRASRGSRAACRPTTRPSMTTSRPRRKRSGTEPR